MLWIIKYFILSISKLAFTFLRIATNISMFTSSLTQVPNKLTCLIPNNKLNISPIKNPPFTKYFTINWMAD